MSNKTSTLEIYIFFWTNCSSCVKEKRFFPASLTFENSWQGRSCPGDPEVLPFSWYGCTGATVTLRMQFSVRLPDCFCFPSPPVPHVPHFFLLFPWCCRCISDTVCSSWDPPSAAARCGQPAWGLWLCLLQVASKWIQDFLAHSFPTSSKIRFPFDTYLWTPFSYTHFHPFDKAHFSGQRFYFS